MKIQLIKRQDNLHITSSSDESILVAAEKNRSWLVAAITNTECIMKYHPTCAIYNKNRHNRLQKADLDAVGSGSGGDNANSKSVVRYKNQN